MPRSERKVTGGVDTHGRTHHAAVIDGVGRVLADRQFTATSAGEHQLLSWLRSHGALMRVGVEGTGAYGANLSRRLTAGGVEVVEVDRPDRRSRRRQGKSDPLDAYAAARAALNGTATGTPKTRTGPVEAVRAMRVARNGAKKARVAAINQLKALVVTAPAGLRDILSTLSTTQLIAHAAVLRPDQTRGHDPEQAMKIALRSVARRITALAEEITDLDAALRPVLTATAPATSAVYGAGPDVVGQLLVSAGDNPDRLTSEAKLAHLCGAAPIPASTGRTDRHRLNRGGDRAANSALHTVVLVRMRHHQPTRDYVERRTKQGLSKREIMRCLKRYLIRELYPAIIKDLTACTT